MFITDLKKGFYDKLSRQHLLVLVNVDVDSVCSAKIIQWLLRVDHVSYTLIPVRSEADLVKEFYDNSSRAVDVVFINCGANVDLVNLLEPSRDHTFYILDSRRPFNISNVYSGEQVACIVDKDNMPDNVPEYEQMFRDDEDENENSDSEDESENVESGNRRLRFTEEAILKRQQRRRWAEKRQRLLVEYMECSSYSTSSALLLFDLAHQLSKDNNDLLWWSILGLTDQFLTDKIHKSKYAVDSGRLQSHVLRLNHETMTSHSHSSTDCPKICVDKELHLDLYRHWSLYESLRHTLKTACHFRTWTVHGKKRLREFLVECGMPLIQCNQIFEGMDTGFRKKLRKELEANFDKHQVDDIIYATFTVETTKHKFSAGDLCSAVSATLQRSSHTVSYRLWCLDLREPSFASKLLGSSTFEQRFADALALLSRRNVNFFYEAIGGAKRIHHAVLSVAQTMLNSGRIVDQGPFILARLDDALPELANFMQPISAYALGKFVLSAYVQNLNTKSNQKRFRKCRMMPLVLSFPFADEQQRRESDDAEDDANDADQDRHLLVVGMPPLSQLEDKPMKYGVIDLLPTFSLFGEWFAKAAQQTGSRIRLPFFDNSIIVLNAEDRVRFFERLVDLTNS